ncbi:MAG: 4Fe-4S binding protein [Clostridia bacterium]|nr:4Fe-4S binding protein [Clostridia bacterium]
MDKYQHSVSLDVSKCTGCTTCLRHCPTEAIRIKDGRAVIDGERCIDCGVCIRICPHKAKKATCGALEDIAKFKYKIALPAPTLYGQFESLDDADYVIQGIYDLGFDYVYEVAAAAELVSAYTRMYMNTEGINKPVISSACPVVMRLIALRFPFLRDNIMPMLPPIEIAAMIARKKAKEEHPELEDSDIGVCFISPCPGKVSYVKNGSAGYKSQVDVVVSISDIYFALLNVMKRGNTPSQSSQSGMIGISWATSGGESAAIFNDKYLATDGIENVERVLEQIDNGNIAQLEFIELCACPGGCVGGTMTVENPFIAKARLTSLRRYLPVSLNFPKEADNYIPDEYLYDDIPRYRPISMLGKNLGESMRMMADIQKLKEDLPGIDCGSCGAPTCRAFAEDVVKGNATNDQCIVMMKKKLEEQLKELQHKNND